MIRDVVAVQIDFCRADCLIDGRARFRAYTADPAIVAIPSTPYASALGLFDVDRIADALFCVIQFLNFDGCHYTYLLRLYRQTPTKPKRCPESILRERRHTSGPEPRPVVTEDSAVNRGITG
jgi:hypothetical protein